MFLYLFTVFAAFVALLAYGALDLGGSVTAVIFLAILTLGACLRALQEFAAKGQ